MDDVYAALVVIDYPDALTNGLRRTLDALRAVLESAAAATSPPPCCSRGFSRRSRTCRPPIEGGLLRLHVASGAANGWYSPESLEISPTTNLGAKLPRRVGDARDRAAAGSELGSARLRWGPSWLGAFGGWSRQAEGSPRASHTDPLLAAALAASPVALLVVTAIETAAIANNADEVRDQTGLASGRRSARPA